MAAASPAAPVYTAPPAATPTPAPTPPPPSNNVERVGNTLRVVGTAPVSDSAFSRYSGIDTLSLQGALSVTLGAAARASGITSVDVNTAGTIVRAEGFQAPLTLDAMSVSDGQVKLTGSVTQPNLFQISSRGVLAQSFLTGGSGSDTLQVTAGSFLDSDFTNVERLDVLTLNGGARSHVMLGAEADNAGFKAVYGTDDGISITRSALSTNYMALVGGYGNDLFSLDNTRQLGLGNSIDGGGAGSDTLQVGTGALSDPAFTRITGIDVLSLGAGSNVTLGTIAGGIGLSTVVAGASNVTLQADSMEGALTLDASPVTAGRVSLSGSKSGSLFLIAGGGALASSTLRGGGEQDTLRIIGSGGDVFADAAFANKRGIESISLAGGNNRITLGANASIALSNSSDSLLGATLFSGTAGGDTITQTAGFYYLDASAALSGVRFDVTSASLFGNQEEDIPGSTIVGGSGIDTLFVGPGSIQGGQITDIEAIVLSGSTGTVTLDENLTGFSTIFGSSGDTTFTQTTEGSFLIDGSKGLTNLFDLAADGTFLTEDTIIGAGGTDSLFLGETSFEEDPFANVTSVEFVSLTGSSSIILGEAAASAGVSSLYGGEDGDSTLQVDAGSYYLNGAASSSNLYILSDASLLAENTIVGNTDSEDTLAVGDGTLRDVDFGNLSGVAILSLMGSDSTYLELGYFAADSGVSTVYGGEGSVTIDLLAGAYDFEAGDATGAFLVNAADSGVMEASTFVGNGEGSTIAFSEGEISDEAFANVSNVGTVLLVESSEITLADAAASAGIASVIGGSGDMIFNQSAGSFLLDGSGGASNLFAIASTDLLPDDTIIGAGEGADTLAITEEGSLNDDAFANVTGVSLLLLSGSSNATLGSAASDAGISEMIAGDGDSTILLDEGAPAILLDGQYASSLLVGFADSALAAESTLYGGEGADTLAFGEENTIDDEAFTNVSGFEVLSVTGGSSLMLGTAAAAANLDSIYGGAGINTITQAAENANALYIDGGDGQLRVELADPYYLVNNTILGGSSILGNTLSVGGTGMIDDSDFTNISGFGTLELEGDNDLVLGSEATRAGITRVIVENGDNSFTISADGPSGVTLDASAGDGNNSFTFDSINQLLASRLLGADGDDTLAFANQGVIADTLFGRAGGIEVLQLSGASDVTLGTHSDASGISTVLGGMGRTTFTQDSLSTKSYYLDGSADLVNGNMFVIANAGQVGNDTLLGGSAIDTLRVSSGALEDISFSNVSSVELLQLTGSGSVVLGANADLSGLVSVVGGMGQNQFTQTSASASSYYLDGSLGSNNLFSVADADQASIDTFIGGVGTDTMRIDQDVIDDYAFANHSSIEVLQLTGASEVTLGSAAASAGISTVYGGSGATSLDASAMTGSLVINAGSGSGASFLKAGSGADNITAGSGADTLTGWASYANTASDTLFGGAGADLFVLGDSSGNGYGNSGSMALLRDFAGGTDALQLHDYGTGASSYRVDAIAGSGYTHQLFDTNSGSDVLLANINYTGTNAAGDLLGSRALFA